MKKIVSIKSAEGSFFEIGKSAKNSYYLRNEFTEIPNELMEYDMNEIKKMFDDMCQAISTCVPVDYASGHPNDCAIVIYDDNTRQMFKGQDGVGCNFAAWTSSVAKYSEFIDSSWWESRRLLTLTDMRRICSSKYITPEELYKILKIEVEDEYVSISYDSRGFSKTYCGMEQGYFLTLNIDGTILNPGRFKFVEVLKKNGVRVMNPPKKKKIPIEFTTEIFSQFDKKWALLTAGDIDNFNTMTISWGSMGTLWGKPVVTVYVRTSRYTYEFMDEYEYFTVSFYDKKYKEILGVMGSKSGRDIDKMNYDGLTPKEVDEAVTFAQSNVTLVCRKIFSQPLTVDYMPDEIIDEYYQDDDPHEMFVGEVVKVMG